LRHTAPDHEPAVKHSSGDPGRRDRLHRRAIAYGVVGALAFVVDYATTILLFDAGVPLLLANSSGFILANLVNFLLGHFWVFGDRVDRPPAWRAYLATLAVSVVGLLLNNAAMLLCVQAIGLSVPLGKVVATALTMTYNFVARDRWVYRRQRSGGKP
jgi:putative flippase GtrA